jgi:hypothetical protein
MSGEVDGAKKRVAGITGTKAIAMPIQARVVLGILTHGTLKEVGAKNQAAGDTKIMNLARMHHQ